MCDMQCGVHGVAEVEGVQAVCAEPSVLDTYQKATLNPVTLVPTKSTLGWSCPRCFSVYAPHVDKCDHCDTTKNGLVPGYIIKAMESDIAQAKEDAAQGQRIVRGSFVLCYVERLLEAVKPRR